MSVNYLKWLIHYLLSMADPDDKPVEVNANIITCKNDTSLSSIDENASVVSDKPSDSNDTIGRVSLLMDDLNSVSSLLNSLKKISPARAQPGRPSKTAVNNKQPTDDRICKIIECLDKVHVLNRKLVDRIGLLLEENVSLKKEFTSFRKERPSYSSVASLAPVVAGESTIVAPQAGVAVGNGVTTRATSETTVTHPELKKMKSKIDNLEQESLNNFLMIRAQTVDGIIESCTNQKSTEQGAGNVSESQRMPQAHSSSHSASNKLFEHVPQTDIFKSAVVQLLRNADIPISRDDIVGITVQGRDTKHLKVQCASHAAKVCMLSTARTVKPNQLYINEYVTKFRASLLYRLRSLKKNHRSLTSVYSRNGSICYKMMDNRKYFIV